MNRYILIHRLRWPSFLLLLGVMALLHKLQILDHLWGYFWPLAMILLGVFMLAERAALHGEECSCASGYPGAPYPGQPPAPPSAPAEPNPSEGGQL